MRRLLLAPILFLAACGGGGGTRGTGLEYYLGADPPSLDPAVSTDVQSGEVVALLFDNLVHFDADAQLRPGLATRWEVDSTRKGYTFHLRHGATFHDGRTIGTREVRASLLRALDPASKAGRQWRPPLLHPTSTSTPSAADRGASSPGSTTTRAAMQELLQSDFVRTARAKGLGEGRVVLIHAFVGRYVLTAIDKRDLPAVQGSILFLSLVFVLVNLLTDVIYAKVDPRVSYD